MDEPVVRLELTDLTPDQIAPLDRRIPGDWPETWREFATSLFVTLVSQPAARADDSATLAMRLTAGIAQDMGGRQPYIPVGAEVMASARARRVVELLEKRKPYKDVATLTGLTESRVRQIESAWRREQIALRQGRLDLA